jgi:transporter family-2 protein
VRFRNSHPRLGAATTVGVFLTWQVVASIAITHFGLLGVLVQSPDLARIGGALLIVSEVVIVQRF